MADQTETGSDAQLTFKVKTSSDKTHTITMPESASVLELKTKLAGEALENIAVDRQRLIYSGRVMKNDETLGSYKIKTNNTIHMVKSAASNPGQPAASSASPSPSQSIPSNMASGTANNPLAGLTGARYAGHQVNLPGMDMFGPDGGMGPPMDEERMSRMMSDPNVQQSMNEVLNNPDFVNLLIDSNPMLRNMPNAREIITSPFMRQMMTNPQMMSSAMRMQRNMRGGGGSFPAPGATDTTADAGSANHNNNGDGNPTPGQGAEQQNPFANPFMMPGMMGQGGGQNLAQMLQALHGLGDGSVGPTASAGAAHAAGETGTQQSASEAQGGGAGGQGAQDSGDSHTSQAANPFAALFPPSGEAQGNTTSPQGLNPAQLMMRLLFGLGPDGLGGGSAPAAPDNRPPEERYAEQLRQLNDMGFYDFDRNVAALRRSGGSVQGAVEHLLGGMD